MDSETSDTKEHVSAMDKIADSFLAEVEAKESAATEPANQNGKAQQKTYKHPMAVDILLALGLLFAMAGLTVSFVKGLTTHSAKTNIMQGNYKAAIGILRSSPIPEFFGGTSADNSEDLLNQALYLDAMTKLDADRNDQTAVQELAKISAGSRFYDLAQDQLRQLAQPESTPLELNMNSSNQSGSNLVAPNLVEPKPEESKLEESKPEAPKPEAPKSEAPKSEAPKPEAPKPDQVKQKEATNQ
ncbi:hypothetical protein KA344_15100 [bacterium]|nr:hypothetical protein [bacterium]